VTHESRQDADSANAHDRGADDVDQSKAEDLSIEEQLEQLFCEIENADPGLVSQSLGRTPAPPNQDADPDDAGEQAEDRETPSQPEESMADPPPDHEPADPTTEEPTDASPAADPPLESQVDELPSSDENASTDESTAADNATTPGPTSEADLANQLDHLLNSAAADATPPPPTDAEAKPDASADPAPTDADDDDDFTEQLVGEIQQEIDRELGSDDEPADPIAAPEPPAAPGEEPVVEAGTASSDETVGDGVLSMDELQSLMDASEDAGAASEPQAAPPAVEDDASTDDHADAETEELLEGAAFEGPASVVGGEDHLADQIQEILEEAKAAQTKHPDAGALTSAAIDQTSFDDDDQALAGDFVTTDQVTDDPADAEGSATPAEDVATIDDSLNGAFEAPAEAATPDAAEAAEAEDNHDDGVMGIEELDELLANGAEETVAGDFETVEDVLDPQGASASSDETDAETDAEADAEADTEPELDGAFETPDELLGARDDTGESDGWLDATASSHVGDDATAAEVGAELDADPQAISASAPEDEEAFTTTGGSGLNVRGAFTWFDRVGPMLTPVKSAAAATTTALDHLHPAARSVAGVVGLLSLFNGLAFIFIKAIQTVF